MKFFKKKILAVMLAAFCVLSMTACRIGNTEFVFSEKKVDPDVLFTLNDMECTINEAKVYLCNFKNLYGTAYGIGLWDGNYSEEDLQKYIKDITLQEVEQIYAIVGLAQKQEVTLSDDEKEIAGDLASEYYDSLTEDEKDFIDASEKEIKKYFEHYILANKMYNILTEGVNEEVSDDEARVIQAQMIFTTKKEDADYVQERITAGADFATLAARYNQNSSMEVFIARGQYPENMENIVYNLDNDQTSDMITTDDGFYFVKCINKFVEEKTAENIIAMKLQKQKAQFDDLFEAYIKESVFHYYDDNWANVKIDTKEEITTNNFFMLYDKRFGDKK